MLDIPFASEENRTHLQILFLEVIYSCQIQSYGKKWNIQFVSVVLNGSPYNRPQRPRSGVEE
jgi:hypothetical protein